MNERAVLQIQSAEMRIDDLFCFQPRHDAWLSYRKRRLDANAPQRIQMQLHHVPQTGSGIAMGEAAPLPTVVGRHRRGTAQMTRQPGTARTGGEIDQQVVVPCTQGRQQTPLTPQSGKHTELAPAAINTMQL